MRQKKTRGERKMEARFYNSKEINIEQLAVDLVRAYQAMGYQAQNIGNNEQMIVQLKKGGELEALVGMQAALSVTLQRNANGVMVAIGQQKWIDKAAVGVASLVIPILWPLTFTAGFGVIRQATLATQVLNTVDGLIHQQIPNVQSNPAPNPTAPSFF
jgi:hypothetical protein